VSRGIPGSTPGHGTVARRSLGCTCDGCRAADSRRSKRNRFARLTGSPGLLPTIVVTRRIHALAAIGWTYDEIGPRLGVTAQNVCYLAGRTSGMVERGIAQRVMRLYDELSGTPGPSNIGRRRAVARGWAPPLAWDDIDDPNETPNLGQRTRGIDIDEWLYLVRNGEEPNRAAERCGVQITAVERAAHRQGRPDVAQMASSARIREEKKAS
jgi:hypothetical protein